MVLILETASLLSRSIRANTAKGVTGAAVLQTGGSLLNATPRKMDLARKLVQSSDKDLIQQIFSFVGNLTGFIGAAIGRISFTATKIWDWLVLGSTAIATFDWNASDVALQQTIAQRNLALGGVWGGAAGQSVGYLAGLAVGVGVGLICPVVGGPLLAGTIATAVAAEALEDVVPAILNAIYYTVHSELTNMSINTYINFRRWLKQPANPIINYLFGNENADKIRKDWGRPGGPSWSMAGEIDKRVEAIKNPFLEGFVEEFIEEAFDSFIEAGYVVGYEIDNAFEMTRLAQKQQLGPAKQITLEPDNQAEAQTVILKGPQTLIKTQVLDAINTHRFIGDRDVGAWVGQIADDHIRARPFTQKIVIQYYSVDSPPWKRGKDKITRATYTVPDVSRAKLDWETIKFAAGGKNGVMWGRYRATATLDNYRQMACYGSSESAAEETLKNLAKLGDFKISGLTITEEKREGARLEQPELQKEPTRIYPAFATIMVKKVSLLGGRPELDGKRHKQQSYRFDLWRSEEPYGFNDKVRELFLGNISN